MVALGLVLILLGLVLGTYTVMGGLPGEPGTDVSLSFLGLNLDTSAVVIFTMGALTLLIIELGVLATRSGARQASRRRAEMQRLRRVEAEVQTRQSAEAQRNATVVSAPAATPAPFARREPTGDTGSQEAVRTDRPDYDTGASRTDTDSDSDSDSDSDRPSAP